MFSVDFETGGYTDFIPGLAFVALGVGVAVSRAPRPSLARNVRAVLAAVVLVDVVALGAPGSCSTPSRRPRRCRWPTPRWSRTPR